MDASRQIVRLGTRGSMLAIAQSRLIADALLEQYPQLQIEIVTLETRGDRNRQIPLARVRDPDFFSAELDSALLNGEVDFCVHSVKDLSRRRPDGILRAAIPARGNPRDVAVFRSDIIGRLRRGQSIRIGSSSARRHLNTEKFLMSALPQFAAPPRLTFSPLRGPVDQRLTRIHDDDDAPGAIDGVVLALAGLDRLWRDPDTHAAVAPLLAGTRRMVLPLSACPAAPGQAALAVECRRDDPGMRSLLGSLHDAQTASHVGLETEILDGLPEDQQSAVGATAIEQAALGTLVYVRGAGAGIQRLVWNLPERPADAIGWDGAAMAGHGEFRPLPVTPASGDGSAVFVAHWRGLTDRAALNDRARIWVSGVKSWRKLAGLGLWIEGCADNLGFSSLVPTLNSESLDLPALDGWTVLTHREAEQSWRGSGVGKVIATYAVDQSKDDARSPALPEQIRATTHFFWGSVGQFRAVRQWVSPEAHHACGAGKTRDALRKLGIDSQAFPSREEWQAWLR